MLSCDNSDEPILEDDSLYYPIEEGNVWVYSVEEINYAVGLPPSTFKYYYKETIGSSLEENSNTFILQRSRSNENSWKALNAQFISQTPSEIRVFDNEEEVSLLKFPLYEGSSWTVNGSEFNLKTSSTYFSSDKTGYLLEMKNDSSAIDFSREFIYFTKGEGPTVKSFESYAYCQETQDCIGKGIITSGKKSVYTLINRTGDLPLD